MAIVLWSAVWLALLRLSDYRNFPDYAPGNTINPRFDHVYYMTALVPVLGIAGALCKRPISWGLLALCFWGIASYFWLSTMPAR
jgi:hypothetical protein